jgi:hypothetical protein
MAPPHIHIFHPHHSANDYIIGWIAEVESLLRSDPNWDGCCFWRTPYDKEAGFHVGTAVDQVRRRPGPTIFIQKVQTRLLNHFRQIIGREIMVYSVSPTCSTDIWETCEEARNGYEFGEPLIPLRELIGFLIVSKLEKQDKWGGTAKNKNFLWATDLSKGGFPKDLCTDRQVLEVADALCAHNVLVRKGSQGETKYALADVATVRRILDSGAFANVPTLRKFFDRSPRWVASRLLRYNQD